MSADPNAESTWKRREFLQTTSAGALAATTWWAVTAKNDALADNQDAKSLVSGGDSGGTYPYEP